VVERRREISPVQSAVQCGQVAVTNRVRAHLG
jgi:hypothetical protein